MAESIIRLSIIIPVYNVEPYIKQCLDSIYTGDNKGLPFEVIVVDDGTLDNSMEIVKKYSEEHENLHILHQKNQGQSVARNTGLKIAKGKYVWFVDSDDWIETYAIKKLLNQIELNSEIDIFVTPSTWKYNDSNKDWIDIRVKDNIIMSGRTYQESGFQMAAWQFITRRSFLIDNGITFYPGIIHEDGLWGFEIMYLAQKVMVLTPPLYCYRQRTEGSVMHNIGIKSAYCIIKVHEQLMRFMDEYVKPEDKVRFQKMHILRIQEASYVVWHLRHTPDFRKYLADTQKYRHHACNACAKLGGFRWKLKCWMMKYPVVNEYFRIIKRRLKACQ